MGPLLAQRLICGTVRRSMRFIAALLVMSAAPAIAHPQLLEVEGLSEPYRTIDVAAPEPGILTHIAVREGTSVRQGQVLATLDNDVHLATLAIAQKNVESIGPLHSAIAELQLRKDRLEKLELLRTRQHARQEEVDRAQAELAVAEAKLLTIQEDLAIKKLEYDKIKAQVERRIVRAPADGIVIKLFKEEGEYAASNDPALFTIVQLDRLLATFSVPSTALRHLQVEQAVEVTFPEVASPAQAQIEFVSPVTDAESGTVRVKARIDNFIGLYRSGERCSLILPVDTKTAKR